MVRLSRSRKTYNKAQYTRIQAVELLATKDPKLIQPALELLDMALSEWPGEVSQLASTHHHRAECFLLLDNVDAAISEFRETFECQRKNGRWLTCAHIDFAWLIATENLSDYFDEAIGRLEEFGGQEIFPLLRYKFAAARALIAHERGEIQAAGWAKLELEEAAKTHTGFRYHPTLCLVEKPPNPVVHKKLAKIAGAEKRLGFLNRLNLFRN